MKKIILAIFFVFLLAAPYFIGLKVEQNLQSVVNRINSQPEYEAKIEYFNRGWFGSIAKVNISLAHYNQNSDIESRSLASRTLLESLDQGLMSQINIDHGLLFFSPIGVGLAQYEVQPILSKEQQQTIAQSLQLKFKEEGATFQFIGQIGLTGTNRGQLDLPALLVSIQEENNSNAISFALGDVAVNYSHQVNDNASQIEYVATIEQSLLDMTSTKSAEEGMVRFENLDMRGSFESVSNSDYFYLGDNEVTLSNLIMLQNDVNIIDAKQLDLTTYVTENEDLSLNLVYDIEGQQIHINQTGNPIDMLKLRFSINRISQQVRSVLEEIITAAEYAEQNPSTIHSELSNLTVAAKQSPPSFILDNLQIQFGNDEMLQLNGAILLAETETSSHNLPVPFSINANMDVIMSRHFVTEMGFMGSHKRLVSLGVSEEQVAEVRQSISQQVDAILKKQIENGMLIEQDDKYVSRFEFKDGEIRINDSVQTIPSILGLTR